MQTQIPLHLLRFGHDASVIVNARVAGRQDGVETLAANIHARGLIEPLIVKAAPSQVAEPQAYLVSDGNRRLAALRMIFGETSDEPIECNIRDVDNAGAFEDSLTAAVLAHQLHPVDQFEAFARLETDGTSNEEIARRFGMTEKQVRQALALGRLSEKIRNAWRAGEIKAETAQRFTLALDHKAQDKAFDKLAKAGKLWPSYIDDELGASDRDVAELIAFAGNLYRDAGGSVVEDLFGGSHVVSDPALLKQVAADKLQAVCEHLRSEGWSWAKLQSDLPSGSRWWTKSDPKELVYEGDEEARLIALTAERARVSDDGSDAFDEDRAEELTIAIYAIEQHIWRRSFSDRQKKSSGCIVTLEDGRLTILFAVKEPAEVAAAKPSAPAAAASENGSTAGKASPAAEPAISQALIHRLTVQLTKATATALVQDPDLALSVLLTGIAVYDGGGLKASVSGLEAGALDLVGTKDVPTALSLIRKLDLTQRMALVAEVAAASLDFQNQPLNADKAEQLNGPLALCNAIDAKVLNAALRGAFDAKDYFNGVNKALCLAAIGEAMGPDFARTRRDNSKNEVATFAIANVPQTGWLPPQLRARGYDGPPVKKPAAVAASDTSVKKAAAAKKADAKKSPGKSKAAAAKPAKKPKTAKPKAVVKKAKKAKR